MPSLTTVLANTSLVKSWTLRRELLARIGSPADETMAPLTLLMAPFGYGKTTLAAQWASLHQGEATIVICDCDTITRASAEIPPLQAAFHDLVHGIVRHDDVDDARERFFRLTGEESLPLVVMLDDLDGFSRKDAGEVIATLLLHPDTPDGIKVIGLCSQPFGHPIGVLTVRNWVRFLVQADLAYTDRELAATRPSNESQDAEATLYDDEVERWPAGVHLLSQRIPDVMKWRALSDYITVKMDAVLDVDSRDLIRALANLPELSQPLWEGCAAALNVTPRTLEDLSLLLPMVRTMDQPGSARLAPSLRACLRRHAAFTGLRRRGDEVALAWLFERDRRSEALALAQASDRWDVAIPLLVESCRGLAEQDFAQEILELLALVPTDRIVQHPDLAFWASQSAWTVGRTAEAERLMTASLPFWDLDDPLMAGRKDVLGTMVTMVRQRYDRVFEPAERALAVLPPSAHHERMLAASMAENAASYCADEWRAVQYAAVVERERALLPLDQRWWATFALPARVDRVALSGDLQSARGMLEHQLRACSESEWAYRYIVTGRLALIDTEQGDPDAALAQLDSAPPPQRSSLWSGGFDIVRATALHALGRSDEAMDALYQAMRETDRLEFGTLTFRLRTALARIWNDIGNTALAEAWAVKAAVANEGWPNTFGILDPRVVMAEIQLSAKAIPQAIATLEAVLAEGRKRRQNGPLIRVQALLAYAYEQSHQGDRCRAVLIDAIRAGAANGYDWSYRFAGRDLRTIIRAPIAPTVRDTTGTHRSSARPILTDRELEVLGHVAKGRSNREIAELLFISPFTVKNHLARIFAVLSVSNRKECVAVAKDLGLI